MDGLIATLVFVLSVIALFSVFVVGSYVYQRVCIPNRFVWLELIDRQDWKTTLQLRKEMRQRAGTDGPAILYTDLEQLEQEGLVESQEHEGRAESLLYEYRLTISGLKRKLRDRQAAKPRTLPRTV